jgi:hypothetical protein
MQPIAVEGGSFEMTAQTQDHWVSQRPDFAWRHVDDASHEHRWVGRSILDATVPTVSWVWDREPSEDDDEDVGEGHYACRICGATVPPAPVLPVHERVTTVTRQDVRLHDAVCGPVVAAQLLDRIGQQVLISHPQLIRPAHAVVLRVEVSSGRSHCEVQFVEPVDVSAARHP